jgi:alginate O-acetyltransferase complex protein AlgI
MFFKYTDFFIGNVNVLFGTSVAALKLALPIGISFYTFQILSYDIDLYRGNAKVQRNFLTFATYVALFPQLIAGPIVRYTHVEQTLEQRRQTIDDFSGGARRFVIGLGKKVLLANVLGELIDIYKTGDENSVLFAWLYIIAYAFHIYFDFSGYSDMAIGLGRIFGFRFHENFNYPYISKSVTEFWRRWHISLSSWFRDYVYIPLGGNRVKPVRHIFNIVFVWFLTGFWHGAGWNFILWGLFFAAMLLIEKYGFSRLGDRLNGRQETTRADFVRSVLIRIVRHIYVMLCVLLSWTLFDAGTMAEAWTRIGALFGVGTDSLTDVESLYYLRSYLVVLIVAAIGSTPLPATFVKKLLESRRGGAAMTVIEPVFIALLLIVCTAYLVDGSFNPFIYFRF